jgi:hypothetical protein
MNAMFIMLLILGWIAYLVFTRRSMGDVASTETEDEDDDGLKDVVPLLPYSHPNCDLFLTSLHYNDGLYVSRLGEDEDE